MTQYSKEVERGLAFGQVLVIPFESSITELRARESPSLENDKTVLICKPGNSDPMAKFAGGMLLEEETLDQAALRELKEETGIIGDPTQLVEIARINKSQHNGAGTFPVVLYLAFGCNFLGTFEPEHFEEFGDEHEVVIRTTYGQIIYDSDFEIPTNRGQYIKMLPLHYNLLSLALQKHAAA